MQTEKRVLFVTRHCYLDDSNGAAVSSRELTQMLAKWGFAVEALSSTMLDLPIEVNLIAWFAERGWSYEEVFSRSCSVSALGIRTEVPPHVRLTVHGIPVTLHRGPTTRFHLPDDGECRDFMRLFDAVYNRFQPDIVMGYGGDVLQRQIFAKSKKLGANTVFSLRNCQYAVIEPFLDVNKVVVPSQFAAEFYRRSLGLNCTILPNPVQRERIIVHDRKPKYLTFVNPVIEKGLYVFARIAAELGCRRPDIPLLVVEARGTEKDVASCGLDLRVHRNVFFMSHTPDPRRFYGVSRVVLVPSIVPETFGRVAAEAMCNGIPVLASNRGALPETLGSAGITHPLPERLTPTLRILPTAEEVAPWVEAIIRHWDDAEYYKDRSRQVLVEAERWSSEVLEPKFQIFFQSLVPVAMPFKKTNTF